MKTLKKITLFLILALANMSLLKAQAPDSNAFITVWEPTGTSIVFPGRGANYTVVVRDLSTNTVVQTITVPTNEVTVIDLTAGVRYAFEAVPGSGTFNGFRVGTTANKLDLKEIYQWGTIKWDAQGLMQGFKDCANMDLTATDKPIFENANTHLRGLFDGCSSLAGNSSITTWDVSKARYMAEMFRGAKNFNQPLEWNVGAVEYMLDMFNGASSFNQPLNWDVKKVVDMRRMFQGASSFNQNLGGWEFRATVNMANMLDNSGLSCENYSLTLRGWADNTNTPAERVLGAAGLEYNSDGLEAKTTLTTAVADGGKGWTITDSETQCIGTSVSLNFNNSTLFSLKENPIRGDAHFTFKPATENTQIVIMSVTGQCLIKQFVPSDSEEISIPTTQLQPGVYITNYMVNNNIISSLKFVK